MKMWTCAHTQGLLKNVRKRRRYSGLHISSWRSSMKQDGGHRTIFASWPYLINLDIPGSSHSLSLSSPSKSPCWQTGNAGVSSCWCMSWTYTPPLCLHHVRIATGGRSFLTQLVTHPFCYLQNLLNFINLKYIYIQIILFKSFKVCLWCGCFSVTCTWRFLSVTRTATFKSCSWNNLMLRCRPSISHQLLLRTSVHWSTKNKPS